ncbi:MAG: BatA domain-containing protein [Planctomycetes bacterium]|nr:BatA domain-containing protein [Planctomycetota bacterium]
MWFAHPGILLGAVGAAFLPLLIHLINRRRYRREPWAATMFLLRAHRQSKRHIQIDHWLLLVVRTLALLAFGIAIARPYLSSGQMNWSMTRSAIDRVIVLDDSLSMQSMREDGQTSFEAAVQAATQIVSDVESGDGIGLVSASSPASSLVDRPLQDATALSAIMDERRCSYNQTDWAGAIRTANEVLSRGKASKGGRVVYCVTDLAGASIPVSDVATGQEDIDRIVIVNVGPTARGNIALDSLRLESPVIGPGVSSRVRFRIANLGSEPAHDIRVQITVDKHAGQSVAIGLLQPGQSIEPKTDVTFESAGSHVVTASITHSIGNVLAADDIAHLAVDVAERLPILLVEPDSQASISDRSLFCLRVALRSRQARSDRDLDAVRTIAPSELEGEILDEFRVIVLGDVPRISERSMARLRRYVLDGGGLIVAMGQQVDGPEYQKFLFGGREFPTATGTSGEPDAWRALFETGEYRLDRYVRADESDSVVRFKIPTLGHGVLADFEGRDDGGLNQAVVRGYWQLGSQAGDKVAPDAGELLHFENALPAMLHTRLGLGRVIVLTTGLSMSDTTLPAKPDFVPFALNLVAFAAGDAGDRLNVETGQPLISRVASQTDNESTVGLGPNGESHPVSIEAQNDSLVAVFRETHQPGIYRLRQGSREQLYAVNPRQDESDLRLADEGIVKAAFGPSVTIVSGAVEAAVGVHEELPRELAGTAMYLLVALVILETWAATSAGSRA